MARMQGRAEITRRKQRLDETFKRADQISQVNLELRSDFARYLTVLVAGFLERSLQELALECARNRASPQIQSYMQWQVGRLSSANKEPLLQLVGSFDVSWRTQ